MEKQALLIRFFEICEAVRLNGRAKPHHARGNAHPAHGKQQMPEGSTCPQAQMQADADINAGQHHPKDALKMPPSARGVLRLLQQEETLNQRTIAKTLHLTAPAVSDAVKKLEQRGLLTRVHGALNNEYHLTLTEKGRDIAAQVSEKERLHAEKLFSNFTQEELDTLHMLMEKLYQNGAPDSPTN